jgi:outer membrane protein assembly factor BamB
MRWATILPLLLVPALAVYRDEAYTVDYHHKLIGAPLPGSTFFHQPVTSSRASLLYTVSDQGIVAAVNPKDGELVWRQSIQATKIVPGDGLVVSAGNSVSAWDGADGKLVWDVAGRAFDVAVLDVTDGSKNAGQDFVAVFEGVVRRLSGRTGNVVWEYPL